MPKGQMVPVSCGHRPPLLAKSEVCARRVALSQAKLAHSAVVFVFFFRDGETTIKIKFSLFEGGGGAFWGQRGKSSKTLFFVGNATTIRFRKCKFYCRGILLSLRRLLIPPRPPLPTEKRPYRTSGGALNHYGSFPELCVLSLRAFEMGGPGSSERDPSRALTDVRRRLLFLGSETSHEKFSAKCPNMFRLDPKNFRRLELSI